MEYLVPKLLFGCGIRSKLAEEAQPFGRRAAFFLFPLSQVQQRIG